MLIGVAGRGWYQEEGKPAIEILPGTIIHIPANVKHWHGAAADSWFAHLAFEVPGEKTSNEWLEPVTDEEYDKLEQNKENSPVNESLCPPQAAVAESRLQSAKPA